VEYLVGVLLAAAVCAFGLSAGFDRDRAFYPTVLIVVASYYILFAIMGSSTPALVTESLVAAGFITLAVAGFKRDLRFAAAGLAGHGVFDFFHHMLIPNPGVPPWWPGFCLAFDILAGILLALLLARRSGSTAGRAAFRK
jgi:hypothetical protein